MIVHDIRQQVEGQRHGPEIVTLFSNWKWTQIIVQLVAANIEQNLDLFDFNNEINSL